MNTILLVEDNPADILLTRRAFRSSDNVAIEVVTDGEQAVARFEQAAEQGDYPSLVLLDLNLPRLSGLEVLKALKSHQEWRRTPVVMLSGSDRQSDIDAAYQHHANGYVTKPEGMRAFERATKLLTDYWFDLVARPA